MSKTEPITNATRRLAGKWQVPLLALSLLLLFRAFMSFRPPAPAELPLSDSLQVLERLVEGGVRERAMNLAEGLLARKDATDTDRAAIRLQRARLRGDLAGGKGPTATAVVARMVEDFQFAREHGLSLRPDDLESLARGIERQGKYNEAVETYETAIAAGVQSPFDLRRHVIDLRRGALRAPADELRGVLSAFLNDLPSDRLDLRNWALLGLVEVLDDLGQLNEAAELLEADRERFSGTAFADRFEYLEALLAYKRGARDDAERRLRALRNHLDRGDEVDAMAGWLLGRTILRDDGPQRPEEAAAVFTDVIAHHGRGRYVTACRVGLSEAFAQLERHDEAVATARTALEEIEQGDPSATPDADVLRVTLGVTADALRREGRLEEAAAYLPLAAAAERAFDAERSALIQRQVAQIYSLIAEQLDRRARNEIADEPDDPAERRDPFALYLEAGEAYQKLAAMQKGDESKSTAAKWRAAELFAQGKQSRRALEILKELCIEGVDHGFTARALLRIGQLRQQLGELRDAVAAYQECYRRFPQTLEGARALVPLAQCFFLLEPNNIELVEKTLRIVLEESEVFTPAAPEFADALFLLGDAMWRQSEPERAIPILSEARERFPQDPRRLRTTFLLADAYRRSALALKTSADPGRSGYWEQELRERYENRFDSARKGFREVIQVLEERPRDVVDRLDSVILRHAYLYEADCRFEVQDYREALQRYELAAGLFKDSLSALAAYIQMIHCHVFLGETQAARTTLSRAMALADAMPATTFETDLGRDSREDWKRYLAWLGASGLF